MNPAFTPDSVHVGTVIASPNFGDRHGRSIDALILHYTGMGTGPEALARLLDPTSDVSCHYLVGEDGEIAQLVAERDRAWHAGRSFWAGETDMNSVSLGIEIVNAGHDGGCPPYPDAQIAAVIALCRDLCARHAIRPARVLAHSDVAPTRKLDPGEHFPWQALAAHGVGLWPAPPLPGEPLALPPLAIERLQVRLASLGYACPSNGTYDAATSTIVTAFQRHYRPSLVDGAADLSTVTALETLFSLTTTNTGG